MGFAQSTPALLIRTSILSPNASLVDATIAVGASSSLRSARMMCALLPFFKADMSDAIVLAFSSLLGDV
jgi:hypothetical protein